MVVRAYLIPNTFAKAQDYFDYVSSLPIVWDGDERCLVASGDGYVELNGSVEGFEQIEVRNNVG